MEGDKQEVVCPILYFNSVFQFDRLLWGNEKSCGAENASQLKNINDFDE